MDDGGGYCTCAGDAVVGDTSGLDVDVDVAEKKGTGGGLVVPCPLLVCVGLALGVVRVSCACGDWKNVTGAARASARCCAGGGGGMTPLRRDDVDV